MTLQSILNFIVAAFTSHGAHHVSMGAVSDNLGWVLSKHWIIRVCHVGSQGCHL
jgi:hypothetical protein